MIEVGRGEMVHDVIHTHGVPNWVGIMTCASFVLIARNQGKSINVLVTEIDHIRGMDVGLASAIRLFVLSHALGGTFP